ncbi:MAG: mechanosensitive ion channel family protein [Bifidobacteriaceae bacterium]|nr:mechanosensitive ion channel family protein [Bifidobacteriaceae bacterium]
MIAAAPPKFAESWPEWARFLIGAPLRIVIILVAAWVVMMVAHTIIKHSTARMAKGVARKRARGRAKASELADGDGQAASSTLTTDTVTGGDADQAFATAYAAARREARFMTLGSVLRSASSAVVWILAICLVLEAVGVNPGLIMTSVGVVGVGLGLGAQSLVKDMLAGLWMLIEDQYGLGDVIDTGAATGVVEAMSLRITTLRDEDGVLWYVPNGTITRIGNKSHLGGPATQPATQPEL